MAQLCQRQRVLKVKLAMPIIGISSIHLLKTFVNADNYTDKVLIMQNCANWYPFTFLLSAMTLAYTDYLMRQTIHKQHEQH